jgi:hypothetical protein
MFSEELLKELSKELAEVSSHKLTYLIVYRS